MVIPITVIVTANAAISTKVVLNRSQNLGSSEAAAAKRAKDANRMTSQVLFISLMTLVSRLLHAASFLTLNAEDTLYAELCSVPCGVVYAASGLFLSVNSAMNFVCYCYFGKRFRDEFMKVIKSITHCGTRSP